MKANRLILLATFASLALSLAALRISGKVLAGSAPLGQADDAIEKYLQGFASIEPIDTHTHVFKNDPLFVSMLKALHLHLLDILVVDDADPYGKALEPQRTNALAVVHGSKGHAVLCTTFDPYKFASPDFDQRAIQQLNADFAQGAVAVKIWKNVGMEIRRPDGKFVMPDDPVFEPIYRDIAAHNRTIVAHLAEPDSCWQPPNPKSPDYSYYRDHPEWYMYKHPEYPSKATILAARDHILMMNPHLRVVGAHLGSMETDVDQIAQRFDRYPNFAVDTAARVVYLMRQPREKVRAFLIKYQDRVLYGTDLDFGRGATGEALNEWRLMYARDWRFFASNDTFQIGGLTVHGLGLPRAVLFKIFHQNAVRWIPGIIPKR
jgi:predicted TIM-barrel fold metal-dependent hydrolase